MQLFFPLGFPLPKVPQTTHKMCLANTTGEHVPGTHIAQSMLAIFCFYKRKIDNTMTSFVDAFTQVCIFEEQEELVVESAELS